MRSDSRPASRNSVSATSLVPAPHVPAPIATAPPAGIVSTVSGGTFTYVPVKMLSPSAYLTPPSSPKKAEVKSLSGYRASAPSSLATAFASVNTSSRSSSFAGVSGKAKTVNSKRKGSTKVRGGQGAKRQ